MITPTHIAETFALYKKHGWMLRRILATDVDSFADVRSEIPVQQSNVDAAWFSRPQNAGSIAWEIRYLGYPPFALVENLDETAPDFDEKISSIETRLRSTVTAK